MQVKICFEVDASTNALVIQVLIPFHMMPLPPPLLEPGLPVA